MIAAQNGTMIRDDEAVTYHKLGRLTTEELSIVYAALGAQYDALEIITGPPEHVAVRDKLRKMVDSIETYMRGEGLLKPSQLPARRPPHIGSPVDPA